MPCRVLKNFEAQLSEGVHSIVTYIHASPQMSLMHWQKMVCAKKVKFTLSIRTGSDVTSSIDVLSEDGRRVQQVAHSSDQ